MLIIIEALNKRICLFSPPCFITFVTPLFFRELEEDSISLLLLSEVSAEISPCCYKVHS